MRPVRFNLNPKEAEIADAISMGKAPDGVPGDGFFATQLSSVVGLARKNSLWPLPLPLLVVALNLWQPWHRIMIYLVLVQSVLDFHHVSVIY